MSEGPAEDGVIQGSSAGPAYVVSGELREDEPPSQGQVYSTPEMHIHQTRRALAIRLFWLVAVVAVLPILALILQRWTKFTEADFREVSTLFTPVVALASAAFGFFFGSDQRNSR
ncbi:hypothetical protein [Streptomyces boncukensis]|uniref:Uncharacterized protein n=1 Tax=Streptomyces boncukensis TaxID=2711219 RepID=A0A6G4X1C6_9ACTN|nr:hypothetical protein [Streptomyces boncukensis]NGO71188.1 hypothetical protein [Streptomyces boncukensis]